MSVWSALLGGQNMRSIEEALGAGDVTSAEMREAIKGWFSLYFQSGGEKEEDPSQRLPVVITEKLAKTVFSEYEPQYTGPNKALEALLGRLDGIKRLVLTQALVGGECLVKPILTPRGMDLAPVRRDCFIPLSRGPRGEITDLGMVEVTVQGGAYYTLLERRTVGADGRLTIRSSLYHSKDKAVLGAKVPLDTLPQYAALQPEITLQEPLWNLGMALLKTPLTNTVDGSQDGVAVYAPAAGLIRNISRNEAQLTTEFDNGASKVIASADLLRQDESGQRQFDGSLFVGLDEDPERLGVTIFSPPLREASYLAREQKYLRSIEALIGLKRGILSEVEAAERTATEITSSAGDYNLTILDFQAAWEGMLRELLPTCDALGRMYKLWGGPPVDVDKDLTVEWGDGVLFDRTRTWQEYRDMVAAGMLRPELALAWYFDLTCETDDDLRKIREKYLPAMEDLLGGEA